MLLFQPSTAELISRRFTGAVPAVLGVKKKKKPLYMAEFGQHTQTKRQIKKELRKTLGFHFRRHTSTIFKKLKTTITTFFFLILKASKSEEDADLQI